MLKTLSRLKVWLSKLGRGHENLAGKLPHHYLCIVTRLARNTSCYHMPSQSPCTSELAVKLGPRRLPETLGRET